MLDRHQRGHFERARRSALVDFAIMMAITLGIAAILAAVAVMQR